MIKSNQNIDSGIKEWVDLWWTNISLVTSVFTEWQNVITSELNNKVSDLARKNSHPKMSELPFLSVSVLKCEWSSG